MAEKRYAVVDIETTGLKASRDRITEIAIVLMEGETVVETFESLVNPECYIPGGITELTGITQEMVEHAPKFYEIARKIVELTESAIFVGHNVRFDYSFVKAEFSRLGFTYTRKNLCTVRLSRKIFPGLPSYSLGSLIYQMDIPVNARHRALEDATATAEILKRILNRSESKAELKTMVNLGIKESLLPGNWTIEKIHELPESCGVYYFHDKEGRVIYVGKSLNIKHRIASHFSDKTEKARKLQELAFDISFELTGSELIALILESQEIKRLRPPINQAQRLRHFPFAIHAYSNEEGYLCFDVVNPTSKTRKLFNIVSAYPKIGSAKSALQRRVESLELCYKLTGLEKGRGPCFHFHLGKCRGACVGKENAETYNERAASLKQALQTYFEEDFFIIDQGREEEEAGLILVEDGICKGFGYVTWEELNAPPESLKTSIKRLQSTPEMLKIIQRFMADRGDLKILPI